MADLRTRAMAAAALLLALGAEVEEVEPAFEILARHPVPDTLTEVVKVAQDALTLHRMERG